jgi:hypothetical protein
MSDKILTIKSGKVVEHEVRSDVDRSSEDLYNALSTFMGIEREKTPSNIVATGIGAIEYACIVAKQVGVTETAFIESVTNVWNRVQVAPQDGAVREQGQV